MEQRNSSVAHPAGHPIRQSLEAQTRARGPSGFASIRPLPFQRDSAVILPAASKMLHVHWPSDE